jgi:hypothetical protein
MKSIKVICPQCGGREFEIRVVKDEGIGAAHCVKCESSFLMLDSGDYWFDAIQRRYPPLSRCSCKGTAYGLAFAYSFRDDGDVKLVRVSSTCASCGSTSRKMSINIDYSPTNQLLEQPLQYCKNPKILYDLKELNLYVERKDVVGIARYLCDGAGCILAGCLRNENEWAIRQLGTNDLHRVIQEDRSLSNGSRFLWIYASPEAVTVPDAAVESRKREETFWKRHEIIRVSSPTRMHFASGEGLLYYIQFSNEFVENESAVPKSGHFRELTNKFLDWLGANFVSWRGKYCFDNQTEHNRIFGDIYHLKGDKRRPRKN